MSEPIVTREEISLQAREAARAMAAGKGAPNPYPCGSDAAAAWQASLDRWLHALHEVEGTEASA